MFPHLNSSTLYLFMTKIISFLLCFMFTSTCWSQEISIKGNIIDYDTQSPVVEALISIKDSNISQLTNTLGTFELKGDIEQGNITISIEKPGYKSRKFDIETKPGQQAHIENIKLHPNQKTKPLESISGTAITGRVTDKLSNKAISGARVSIANSYMTTTTDENGDFLFKHQVPDGPLLLKISETNFTTKTHPIFVSSGKITHVDDLTLGGELYQLQNQIINPFAEDQLHSDYNTLTNNSSFYQGSNSLFLNTATYQYGAAFFKARAQNHSEGNVMINGILYNSPLNGDTDWNALSGITETLENNSLDYGLSASKYQFNGNLGTLNINTRASSQRAGGQIAYLSSSQRYRHGVMGSYATGMSPKGLALAISAIKRTAFESGYFNGTDYDSNAFLLSAEARLNSSNFINISGFFNSTKRGGRSANTDEVYNLKNDKYNSYWGVLNEDKINARTQQTSQPFLMLNYILNLGAYIKVQTNIAYNFGSNSRSDIDFQGTGLDDSGQIRNPTGENPDPSYYTKLPSYFLADPNNPDYENAYLAQESFKNYGQINWASLYASNVNSGLNTSTYALYNHVIDQSKFSANSLADIKIHTNFSLNAGIGYSHFVSNHYAEMDDLLGGTGYLDVNPQDGNGDAAQSNLLTPNRVVTGNDTFRYHYDLNQTAINGFIQGLYRLNQHHIFIGIQLDHTNQYRFGNYQNGRSPNLSLGEGRPYRFLDYSIKGGIDFKLNSQHTLAFRGLIGRNAPTLNQIFLNPLESDNPRNLQGVNTVSELAQAPELIPINSTNNFSSELNYTYNSALFKAEIAGYFTSQSEGISNKRFVGNSINGQSSSSIQEVLTNINKRYMGIEIGASYQILKDIKLKTAMTLGDFIYTNNPQLHYVMSESEVIHLGEVGLDNYKLSNTPSQVFSLGFKYRDTNNWWFEASGNYFMNHYIDNNPYYRTKDFFLDDNGTVFSNYQPEYAAYLLKQDKIDNYLNINLFGGKFWNIKTNYIGFKAGINNVLGQNYNIAGFETPGQLKYDVLLEDANRKKPLYGNRFWKGYGSTYFLNVYYRF